MRPRMQRKPPDRTTGENRAFKGVDDSSPHRRHAGGRVRGWRVLAMLNVIALLCCCGQRSEPACTESALESYFWAHESVWNIVYQKFRSDPRVPDRGKYEGVSNLSAWLPQEEAEPLSDLGVDALYRDQVSERPVLFIELCTVAADEARGTMGYALRLDSSAGAQDPLDPEIDALDTRYVFRHIVAGLHTYWTKAGRVDA